MKLSTFQKLINHEASARRIGNIAEADAYAEKIRVAEKSVVAEIPSEARIVGEWLCSCGAKISLDMPNNESGQLLKYAMLSPHYAKFHYLAKTK